MPLSASFIAAPAPGGPSQSWRLENAAKTGRARSNASRGPPAITVNVASSAEATLPETGASSIAMPRRSNRAASSRAAAGPIVLISHTIRPRRSTPASTSRAAASSETMVISTSAWAAASAGEDAISAPSSSRGVRL
jgi:hypothetical protein